MHTVYTHTHTHTHTNTHKCTHTSSVEPHYSPLSVLCSIADPLATPVSVSLPNIFLALSLCIKLPTANRRLKHKLTTPITPTATSRGYTINTKILHDT